MPEPVRVPVLDTEGLHAWANGVPQADGSVAPPRDRRGRLNVKRVDLAAPAGTEADATGLPPADEAWLLAADSRAWPTVQARFGDAARQVALALARAGVVTLTVPVVGTTGNTAAPLRWRLAPRWSGAAAERREDRAATTATIKDRARALAEQVRRMDPGLADALDGTRGHEPAAAPVLVAAAEDLLAGVVHDGPRAFSQAHFDSTKKRHDAPDILTAAGASETTLAALGLSRSPYLGLGGRIALPDGDGRAVDLRSWPGPVRFRVSPALRPGLLPGTRALVLVENLQAAETASDAHSDRAAVVWFAGQPSDQAVAVIASLAADAPAVHVAPDADWGGARIAARLLAALPDCAVVLDCGTAAHQPRDPFGEASLAGLAVLAQHDDLRVAAFAAAVLGRGYPVEQEASARAVLAAALAAV